MTTDYVMGQALKDYQPAAFSLNRVLNDLLAPSRLANFDLMFVEMQKEFPDLSFWQGLVDWQKLRTKTDTIIIRLGQGRTPDREFSRNWRESHLQGMLRGCYIFYDDRVSPGEQAALVVSMLSSSDPELPVVVDWETSFGGPFGSLGNVVACMEAIERDGYQVMLYTGYYWFVEHSNAVTNASHYNYLKSRPLWLAWYANDPNVVRVPAPWTQWTFWQYGTPIVDESWGVQSRELDMNWWNGTTSSFYDWVDRVPPTIPEEESPMTTVGHIDSTATLGVRVRTEPNTNAGIITRLYPNTAVTIDRSQDDGTRTWLHILTPVVGWLAGEYVEVDGTLPDPSQPLHTIETFPDGSVKVDGRLVT